MRLALWVCPSVAGVRCGCGCVRGAGRPGRRGGGRWRCARPGTAASGGPAPSGRVAGAPRNFRALCSIGGVVSTTDCTGVVAYRGSMGGCEACGEINPPRAHFCLACGQPLGDEPKTAPGRRRSISIIFADLVGSTALGESLDAEALRYVTGRYFETMRLVADRHGGTVEKFIGDAVVAMFGIPRVREDDALRAVRATMRPNHYTRREHVLARQQAGSSLSPHRG